MGQNNPAPQSGTGGAYTDGPNPYPGGEIDTGISPIPPYDGRSGGADDSERAAMAEGTDAEPASRADEGGSQRP